MKHPHPDALIGHTYGQIIIKIIIKIISWCIIWAWFENVCGQDFGPMNILGETPIKTLEAVGNWHQYAAQPS